MLPNALARRANEFGCRSGLGQIAGAPSDLGAGALTVGRDRLQSLEPRRVGALSMQHQALSGAANRRATAAPIPDPPPVMIETRMHLS